MNTIGERIRALREDADMSQKELAQNSEITEATLSRYENDLREPKASVLIRLATELNTSTDFLLGRTDLPYIMPSSVAITSQEMELIKTYRSLSGQGKIRLLERAEALGDTFGKTSKK